MDPTSPGAVPEATKLWQSDTSSLAAAIESEQNKLVSMHYPKLKEDLYASLDAQKCQLEAMICKIFQVSNCRIIPSEIWTAGTFNVAILVRLPHENVYLRLPFPHRIGEQHFPGNAEEKLRTEIATYLWLQEHCKDVPIPNLYAFGLPDGSVFTSPGITPWWRKIPRQLDRMVSMLLGRPTPIQHVGCSFHHGLPSGFLVLSEAEGKPLAKTWGDHFENKNYRSTLFRGLARIALSLNSTRQPRIASLSLQPDNRTISLCNRPLNMHMHMIENDGVPSGIPRERTYLEVDPYISDLLSLQDSKLRYQPNSMLDTDDGKRQMAALTCLRATLHHFLDARYRQGPFYLTLTDLHRSNIFVDENWNIKTIIDLEWTHTLPVEMQSPPYWLTSKAVDGFKEKQHLEEYEKVLKEYLAVYKDEEIKRNGSSWQAELQLRTWQRGSFWFFHATKEPKAMYNLFNRHIQPAFDEDHPEMSIFDEVFCCYWGYEALSLIDKKLGDRKAYIEQLREEHYARSDDD
ncbi:hypothetical protein PWT90_02019 [Aphanocladium album]|nr:hypothetical protein PWT90_02019 [Aphanocladium album]